MNSDDYRFIDYLLNDIGAQYECEKDPEARKLLDKLASSAAALLNYFEEKEEHC